MNCKDVLSRLNRLEMDRMDSQQRETVADHLNTCPSCRRIADMEAAIDSGLDQMFVTDASDITGPAIRQRGRAVFRRRWMTGFAVAAVLLLTIGITAVWRNAGDDRIRGVLLDTPVRQASISSPVFRIPEIREQAQLAVNVRQIRDNIVWVSIRN